MIPELYDITRFYQHKGLIGESDVAVTLTLLTASSKPIGFGIEASAGSGKTVLLDTCFGKPKKNDGLIDQKYTYFKDAGSEKSMSYDADEINSKEIIVMSELQKDKGHNTIEAIKSLTEGKSAIYRTVDITKGRHGGIREMEIKPKTVIYSLAIENDTKPDAELNRRFITMATDISQEQTHKVVYERAKSRWDHGSTKCMTEAEIAGLKGHTNSLIGLPLDVLNPYAEGYSAIIAKFAPDQKVRSMAEHFWDLMESIVKFNYAKRVSIKGSYIANVQDLLMTLDLYKHAFIRDVYGVPSLGDNVLKAFDHIGTLATAPVSSTLTRHLEETTPARWLTVNNIRKIIKEEFKIILSTKVIFNICRQLVDAGYLEDRKEGTAFQYHVIDAMKEMDMPDIAKLVSDASVKVKKRFPAKYESWKQLQSRSYIHPLTGQEIEISIKQ